MLLQVATVNITTKILKGTLVLLLLKSTPNDI